MGMRRRGQALVTAAVMAGFGAGVTGGNTWYVSNGGSDSNSGSNPNAPLATLSAAAQKAVWGDSLYLARGSMFREQVNFTGGLTIDAFGATSLPNPIVSGSIPVSGWQPYAGGTPGTYVANVGANLNLGYVFANKQAMTLARFPNSGWLKTYDWNETSAGTNTVVTSQELSGGARSAPGYWDGANMRWHRFSWWFDTRQVTSSSTTAGMTQVALNGQSSIALQPSNKYGWGFYMDNKLSELDAPGEYYYDKSAGKLYFNAPNGANPNTMQVEAAVRDYGLSTGTATVRNVVFEQQKDVGLYITGQTTVENSVFRLIGSDAGGKALYATWDTNKAVVRNNLFTDNFGNALEWNENPYRDSGSLITHNTFLNSGTVAGYGGNGSWHGSAIVVPNGEDIRIEENYINGTGYAGIIMAATRNSIERNVIDNAMMTLNDGAGIYIAANDITVRGNIIRSTRGGMESSGPWANLSHGIWVEYLTDFKNNTIDGNVVSNSGGWGIFLSNAFNSTVTNNVLYGNDRGQIELEGMTTNYGTGRTTNTPQNNVIRGNVLVGTDPGEYPLLFQRGIEYGTIDGNFYLNAAGNQLAAVFDYNWYTITGLTVAQWKAQYPSVADARVTTLQALMGSLPVSTPELFINDGSTPVAKALSTTYVDLQGHFYFGTITLPAYSGMVLIKHAIWGDANFDGVVDRLDMLLMTPLGTTWATGDFNGDGRVSADDYALLGLGVSITAQMAAGATWVPEPHALGMAGAVASVAIARRPGRRR